MSSFRMARKTMHWAQSVFIAQRISVFGIDAADSAVPPFGSAQRLPFILLLLCLPGTHRGRLNARTRKAKDFTIEDALGESVLFRSGLGLRRIESRHHDSCI